MPKKIAKMFTAWSWSRLAMWEECPLRAKLKFLDGLSEGEKGAPLVRGAEYHKKFELYLKGKEKTLPKEADHTFGSEFRELKKTQVQSGEIQLAVDEKWQKTEWFGPTTWLRCILDAMGKMTIKVKRKTYQGLAVIDFKTGQHRPAKLTEYEHQMKLFAPVALIHHPKVEAVQTQLWFTDTGDLEKDVYTREQLPELVGYWQQRSHPMLSDKRFDPKPGGYCTYCPYSRAKGGPCKF